MSKLNQDQGLMDSILAKEWHTLYAEEIILVMNYAKEQQAIINDLKAKLNNMEACYIEKKNQVDEALTEIGHYWKTGATDCIESAEESLRGEHESKHK